MQLACYMEGSLLMWMMLCTLNLNAAAAAADDDDDDDDDDKAWSRRPR